MERVAFCSFLLFMYTTSTSIGRMLYLLGIRPPKTFTLRKLIYYEEIIVLYA